jgi:hypothetical protein
MAEYDVLGTKLIVTDMNMPAPTGSSLWVGLFNGTKVDLSKSDADNLIMLTKVPEVADGTYAYAAVQAKTKALIGLVQDALAREVEAITGKTIERDVDGVYNCSDAQLMLMVAQTVNQQGAGSFDNWPLGPQELAYLLTRSTLFQAIVRDALSKDGKMSPEQQAAYQYSVISFPADQAPGMTFVPAQVPANCTGKAPAMPAITPGSMCGVGLTYDPVTGTCKGAGPTTPVAYEQKPKSNWLLPTVAVLAVVGAGGAAWYYMSHRKAQPARNPTVGKWALVKAQGLDDFVLSTHKTKQGAETAMRRHGGEPDSMFTRGMRVVDVGPTAKWELIEVFGRRTIRPR